MPKWRFVRATAVSLMILGFAAQTMQAQKQDGNELGQLNLEQLMKVQFYTASKHPQDAGDAPASVTIVTREDIRTFGYRTLADILNGVRGFWVNDDRNYVYLGVRGISRPGDYNTRILIMINGHRVNDNIYEEAQIGTELPLNTDLIERVEIVRGPTSSLYGTNAFLGVVNVITAQPPLVTTVNASVEAGSLFTRKASVTVGLPEVLNGALLSASMYRSDGNENLYFPEFDSPATNHGIAHDVDADGSKTAFLLMNWKNFQLESIVGTRQKRLPTASFGTIFGDAGSQTTDTHLLHDVRYQRSFASGLQLTSRSYYDTYNYHGTYPYEDEDATRIVGYDEVRADSIGTEFDLSRPLGRHNAITAGTEFRYNVRQVQRYHNVGSPVFSMDSHRSSNVFAVFVEDELKLGPRLLINAGVRMDHYSTFGAATSPRFAAVFRPDGKTQLKYTFGHAFRAPSVYETFSSDGVSQETNPALKPETLISHNVSVERLLTPETRLVVEAFYSGLSDLIDLRLDESTGLSQFVNLDSAHTKGVEVGLEARRGALRGRLDYTLQRSTHGLMQAALANSPEHVGKFKLQLPVRSILMLGAELHYVSARLNYGRLTVPSSLTADLTVTTRKPVLGFDVSASCYNLLDRRNYDPVSPDFVQNQLQQDGRGLRLKIERTFSLR